MLKSQAIENAHSHSAHQVGINPDSCD
jgi:hypothetical protein